jgi:CelD/BcsL family acetyltransferase involved in cellulose biosynthesis
MLETLCDAPEALCASPLTSSLYQVSPLSDPRWPEFLANHPRSSVFHSRPWLEALRRTYGYEPVAYTTQGPGRDLQNAAVFCRIESRLTGRRLVSLPFSDHCDFLIKDSKELPVFLDGLEQKTRQERWRYIEIRPLQEFRPSNSFAHPSASYSFHHIDLTPDLETLLANCHKSSTQRKIQRANREGLRYEEGVSKSHLDDFYKLLVTTRRRHSLPPQPKSWFLNLIDCFGDDLKIRLAIRHGRAVAGMLTIRCKDTLIYKNGGSDSRFHNLGAMHMLYWESIRDAKAMGLRKFDLGRTDADQAGLIKFKSRWGAQQSAIKYWRFSAERRSPHIFDQSGNGWKMRVLRRIFSLAPTSLLPKVGNLLYRHAG